MTRANSDPGSSVGETMSSVWSVECLLMYPPPDAQDRLFDCITALSAPGSSIATASRTEDQS